MRVVVQAVDPLSRAGVTSQLERRPEVVLLTDGHRHLAEVAVVVVDRLTDEVVARLRRAAEEVGAPVVLVPAELGRGDLLTAVRCRVVAVLPRNAVTGERLLDAVLTAAAGGGALPPNLVGGLIQDVERLQREVLEADGAARPRLSPREERVLRLMAEGMDTAEIATELAYSERTVKSVIHGVTSRFKLRNRPHAVAYAVRSGLI